MADEWSKVSLKVECEAYLPEPGDKIGTLNGVETANPNTVVIRQRHADSNEWHVFITDREAFDARYSHNLWSDESDEENQEVEDSADVADTESDTESDEDSESESGYWDYTVPQLRDLCNARNLDSSGLKPELVARLEEND